ncbi:MAG: GMC family oxidoreductase [Alphaproteobacteria bacterium]|nr:GMC family oxidoreductase [Alphaproteobacteria bacterium]
MITHGRELTGDTRIDCDVVVVGSGCGGATLAMRLAEEGRDVVVLEQGGHYTSRDFDQREANMLAKIDGGRGLDTSEDGSVSLTYGNNVGGASVHYWADSYRTPPDRLARWAEEFGIEGHDLAALSPHFDRIERDLNVHEADDSYVNEMNRRVLGAARAFGWDVKKVPQARRGCARSGHCMQGCAYDAKQSQLVTHIARADALGARIHSDVRAERLVWEGSRVAALEATVVDRGTQQPRGTLTVRAKQVVVAAGGYGTPTFLLKQGLKERLPHLGEHFFCNPCPMIHAVYDEPIVQWRNIPAAWGVEEFRLARFDGDRYVEGGYLLMPNQLQPAMLAAVLPGAGPAHRALMANLANLGGTIAWIDDAEEGSIRLEGGVRKIHVPLDGLNGQILRDAWIKQCRVLFETGAKELIFGDAADTRITRPDEAEAAVASIDLRPSRNVLAAPHPGGCARMGRDASDSVVGFDHRVHGTDNLYVADPSVFPTAPSVDPSLTIMAFSYVAAAAVDAAL